MTHSQAWHRGARAIHEITGSVDPVALRTDFNAAIDRYLGPALGMSVRERWEHHTTQTEREILVEALEERSAIMFDGPKPRPQGWRLKIDEDT